MSKKGFISPGLTLCFGAVIWFWYLPTCEGLTISQCAQFGVNRIFDLDTPWLNFSRNSGKDRKGYWTIGAQQFDSRYITFLGSEFYVTPGPFDNGNAAYLKVFNYTSNDDPVCPVPETVCGISDPPCLSWWRQTQFCVPDTEVQIRTYVVKQNGRVLKGWLHVEVELVNQSDNIGLIYIQMRDQYYNAIGEFVGENEATCRPSKESLVGPTKFQLYPCSAVGLREPKNSHGIFMADPDLYIDPEIKEKMTGGARWIPKKNISRGVHFLWKMDEYWCNRHQRFQPFAYIFTKKSIEEVDKSKHLYETSGSDNLKFREIVTTADNLEIEAERLAAGYGYARIWRKITNHWIYPQWYGATDIVFADGELDCSELAVNDKNGQVTNNGLQWLQNKATRVTWGEDNFFLYNLYPGGCQADTSQTYDQVPVFSGRCATLNDKAVGMDVMHSCDADKTLNAIAFEGVNLSVFGTVTYSQYKVSKVEQRLQSCPFPCRAPRTPQDYDDILAYPAGRSSPKQETGPNETKGGAPLKEQPFGKNLRLVLREEHALLAYKYHGILAVVITFFITPVSSIMARYYKETFMKKRCFGIHVWYWVHGVGILMSFALFSSGHAALNPYIANWGSSTHKYAIAHTHTGYVIWTLFALMLVLGGFRPKCTGTVRLIYMTLHSVFGFAYQWLNFIAVILSTGIPLSPTAGHCDILVTGKGFPIFGSGLFLYLTIGFMFIIVAFDVFLLVFQCVLDGREEVRRGWWCPIINILPTDHLLDYVGSGTRKFVFLIFLVVSGGFTIFASITIAFNDIKFCQLGETTCSSQFGCSKLANKYGSWVSEECGVACGGSL